jgi:Tfp pilus assembly protein PilF
MIALAAPMAAFAKESPAAVKAADQDIAKGNLKAAEIELRNAVREAPQDPTIRAKLAEVYLQLGDPISAEREARAARERNGAEVDYLPVLADALLRQGKYAQVVSLIEPGNRPAALESELRLALGRAQEGQHDAKKAEAMLRDAVRLAPKAAPPKIALARLLLATKRRRPALDRGASGQGRNAAGSGRPGRCDEPLRRRAQNRSEEHPGASEPGKPQSFQQ